MPEGDVKRLVVTGATGFIGQSFLYRIRCHFLDQFEPVALIRPSSDIVAVERLLDHPTTDSPIRVVDFSSLDDVTDAVKDADVIVHLAADMDFFPSEENLLVDRNVSLTKTLFNAASKEVSRAERSDRPLRFVYVSSTEAIGPTAGPVAVGESAALHPTSAYGLSKKLCEGIAHSFEDQFEVVIVRPTGVFGPGERFFFYELMQVVASGLCICAPSPLNGRVIFTHVEDVVEGLILCAKHPDARGIYNLCADAPVSHRQIIECISDVLQYPRPKIFLPLPLGQLLISVIAPIMNFGKRRTFMYHAKSVRESVLNRDYSNQRLKELGFQPKHSMLAGIEETVNYELQTGGLRRSPICPAIHRCLQFVSVVLFSIRKTFFRRRDQFST